MGALNNLIPFSLLFWSQTIISSGLASILNAVTPIFSMLLAHALTQDEKISASKLVGIALGVLGVVVLMGWEAVAGSGQSSLAILACLGAALSYGFANVFGRRFRGMGIEPAVVAFGQITATTAMMLPISLVFDAPWQLALPGPAVWASLVGLAFLSTALAYIIFFRLLSTAGATNTSLVTLLIPVSAILLGSMVLGERLSAPQLMGMALIGLGLVAIDGRLWTSWRHPASFAP
jgi:drug/metabolite transporter (DMT)-like permease